MPQCPLCRELAGGEEPSRFAAWLTRCDRCGPFHITEEASEELATMDEESRAVISAWTKELELKGASPPYLASSTYERPADAEEGLSVFRIPEVRRFAPRSVNERLDRILLNLGRMSKPGEKLALNQNHRFVCYADSPKQALYFLEALNARGLVDAMRQLPGDSRVTPDGWSRIATLENQGSESDQVFVAMSFATELEDAWKNGLEAGIEATGLNALRIDRKEHNEKICDLIIAEIRKSCLLVADFTLHRQGVYFEAGFAMGLGIPVIWTCRKDQLDQCHFDTRQYNHIDWEQPAELRERLRRRIEATLPHVLKKQ